MGEKAAKFVIERASVLNFWYKVFQTVAAAIILAGFYSVWAKSEAIIQAPEHIKELQKGFKDHAKKLGVHDTILIEMNGKLDLLLKVQSDKKEKEIKELLKSIIDESKKKEH